MKEVSNYNKNIFNIVRDSIATLNEHNCNKSEYTSSKVKYVCVVPSRLNDENSIQYNLFAPSDNKFVFDTYDEAERAIAKALNNKYYNNSDIITLLNKDTYLFGYNYIDFNYIQEHKDMFDENAENSLIHFMFNVYNRKWNSTARQDVFNKNIFYDVICIFIYNILKKHYNFINEQDYNKDFIIKEYIRKWLENKEDNYKFFEFIIDNIIKAKNVIVNASEEEYNQYFIEYLLKYRNDNNAKFNETIYLDADFYKNNRVEKLIIQEVANNISPMQLFYEWIEATLNGILSNTAYKIKRIEVR